MPEADRLAPWSWLQQVPMSRRKLLKLGSLGLAGTGLTLQGLLAADAARPKGGLTPLADNCILMFLNGGPSHLAVGNFSPLPRHWWITRCASICRDSHDRLIGPRLFAR